MIKQKVDLLNSLTIEYAKEIKSVDELKDSITAFKVLLCKVYLKERGMDVKLLNKSNIEVIKLIGE